MEPEYLLDSLFNNDKLAPIRVGERLTTPLEELNKYDQGLNRFLDQYDNRAANQTSWDARGNALVQAGAEVLGTTIEGIGYLADLPQYVNLIQGTEAEFGNVFSDIGKSIKEGAREEFGIYGGDGFDPISPRWWAKNAASIASSLSLLIPSMGVVKGAAWLNKITSLSTKAAKTLSGSKLANGLKLSKNAANLEKGLRSNLKGITGAVTSRYMEATMEASGKFDEEFQKGIQQGLSEEEAKLKAGKAASKVWYANQALLLADFFQFKTLFGVNPTKLMNLGKQVVTEGLEEGVQFGFGKEAENSDNVLQLYGNVLQNFPEYFDDPEFLTSITMGAVGGGFFTGMGLATEKIFKKNIEQNKKYEEAVIKGDKTAATEIKDEILSEKTVEELEAYLELVDDADQKIKIQKVIETKKISTQEPTTKDLADQKSKALSKYQLDIENKETSIKELQADKYFQEKLKEFNEGRDTPISPNAFVELLMKSREYSLSSKKLTYRNLFIEDVNEDYDFDLRDDLKKNNGKLVRAVDSLRSLEINIEKNSDIIDKIDNNPEEAKKDQVKEKVNEIKEQASKLKNVPDLAKLARQAETIEEKEAVNKEIGNKISETREELEDIAFSSNTPEDFINNIPEESKQNTSQEELNEILNQAFPDEDIDLSQMTNVRPAFPEDVKEISGSPKQTIENKPSLAEPKRSNIEDLSDGNPTKGKTQDVRIAFNPKFNKENQELNEEKRKKLQIAGKIEDPVKRKEAIAKINEDYSQISFNSKYVITDQDDKFLAEVLDHYELSKEQYREVIYNIDKYADKPIEFDTFTSRDGNLVGVYLMDGKYPIALAPTFERVVKILEDKGKLKDTKITDSGKVIGNFESVELEVELENLRLLWKYGGKVKLSRTQGGRLRYMKGQYNAVNNFHKLLSDIATDAIIYTPTPKGNVFLNGKGLPAGARMERDSNQSAGRFYLALRDTAGNYRPSRLRTIALHEHEQSFNELKNILGIAEKASIFFKDAKIDKKNMIASMESYLEKNKDKEFYEEAEDWLSNSTEYYETISEYIVKNNKDFYVRTGLIFNGNFFSTKEINGKKVRSFNGLKFLTKKGVVQLNKKVNNLSELTPQSIENSTSVQIKISRFQETKFNEIADRLETTMKSLEQPFVSPTFFFDLEPNVPSEQVSETGQQANNIKARKAEIERRREEVERISKLPFVERIPALKKAGIIASDITYNIGKRFPIILNIAGTKVAFYRSSEGTDGKEKGAWTPMFGYGEDEAGNPWLIKGDVDTQVNTNYNSNAIQEYAEILNKTLNWPHELDKGQVKNHPYFKVLKLAESKKAFNKELYGIEDLGIINRETNVSGFINSKLKEINDKYNAELVALEPSQQASNVKSDFDPALAKKIQDKLEKLYPEIKLVITNTPKWEKGDNVMNQKDYDNQIKYTLKAVNILASDKATQVFAKGKKNGWDLNKILTELQVPKEQKQIILDKYKDNKTVNSSSIFEMIKSGEITYTDENNKPCKGGLTKGGIWKIL